MLSLCWTGHRRLLADVEAVSGDSRGHVFRSCSKYVGDVPSTW